MSPMPQTGNWSWTFFCRFLQQTRSSFQFCLQNFVWIYLYQVIFVILGSSSGRGSLLRKHYYGCTDFASEVQSKRTLAASKLKQTAGFQPSLELREHKLNQTAEAVQA